MVGNLTVLCSPAGTPVCIYVDPAAASDAAAEFNKEREDNDKFFLRTVPYQDPGLYIRKRLNITHYESMVRGMEEYSKLVFDVMARPGGDISERLSGIVFYMLAASTIGEQLSPEIQRFTFEERKKKR